MMSKTTTMSRIKSLLLTGLVLTLVACQPKPSEDSPADLAGMRALLQMKRAEQKALSSEISDLEAQIEKLDTTHQAAKRLVTVAPVQRGDFNHYVTVQGNVESDDIVNASSEIGGRLTLMNVEEGQYVKRGQKIAAVDLENLQKQIAEVEKSLELATDVYDRQSRLWNQKIGSEIQYLQAKNNKERLEKSLETLHHQLSKGNVYAPISGAVDVVFLKAGEMAQPGMPIIQILNTSQLKVVADVPEDLLGSVKRGDWVDIHFPALAEERKARISLLGRSIDPANRTFEIEMNIRDRSGLIKPNLLAEIRINDYTEENVILIPLDLVQQEVGGRNYVMVKGQQDAQTIASKAYVLTGDNYQGTVVIKDGIAETHEIIVDGARGLQDGEQIEIAQLEMASDESK